MPTTTTAYGASYSTVETDPSGAAAVAARLYLSVLGRAHDGLGLADAAAFLRAGNPPAVLANRLAASPEFASRSATLGNADFVQSTYASALGRTAVQGELDFYVSQIASGGSRAGVSAAIAASPESRQALAAAYPSGIEVPNPFAIAVARAYDAALGRAPDEAGLVFYRDQLASGSLTVSQLSDTLARSPEFADRYAGASNADLVTSIYAGALGRTPSASEVDFYASQLASGALTRGGLVLAFAEAPEQQASFARSVDEGVNERPPTTQPPVTEPPVTEPPVTEPPAANQPPVVTTAPTAAVTEDAPTSTATGSLVAGASDPEGGTLTVASVGGAPAPGTVAGTYGTLTWAADGTYTYALDNTLPATNALSTGTTASDNFAFVVSDGQGGSATSNLTVTVNGNTDVVTPPANQPPVAGATVGPVAIQENTFGATIGTVSFTDPNSDALIYTFTTTPTFWAQDLEIVGTTLKLQDSQEFDLENPAGANVTIVVTGTDPSGASATQNFTVVIGNQNETPFNLTLSNQTVAENSAAATVVGALSADDVDAGDTRTFTVSGNPNFAVDTATSTLVVAPGATLDFEATPTQSVTVTATDAGGATANQTFTIALTDVAENGSGIVAAVATADSYNTAVDTPLTVAAATGLLANDAGDPPLLATAGTLTATNGSGGTLALTADGSFTYTPFTGFTGTDTFTYTLNDDNETVQGTASFGVA